MKFKQSLLCAAACALACALAIPAAAAAESYTLDGTAISQQKALAGSASPGGGGCASMPSPAGEIACFSSESNQLAAVNKALDKDAIAPGFAVRPSVVDRNRTLAATSKKKRKSAHISACGTAAHNWTGGSYNGNYTFFYSTGTSWYNWGSPWNNDVSSSKAGLGYGSHYHWDAGGHGHHFDNNAGYCPGIPNLTAFGQNNVWSSYASWY